jgi:hypothetical protein
MGFLKARPFDMHEGCKSLFNLTSVGSISAADLKGMAARKWSIYKDEDIIVVSTMNIY